jgi:hypothetical protein
MNRLAKPLLLICLATLALLGSACCGGHRYHATEQAAPSSATPPPAAPAAGAAPAAAPRPITDQDHQAPGERDLGPGANKEQLGNATGR